MRDIGVCSYDVCCSFVFYRFSYIVLVGLSIKILFWKNSLIFEDFVFWNRLVGRDFFILFLVKKNFKEWILCFVLLVGEVVGVFRGVWKMEMFIELIFIDCFVCVSFCSYYVE